MNFGRGLREGHNYFMGVHSTIASSEAIAFFCRIFSFPGRNVLYIPSYEQTRLAIDKNICEEISRLLCQLKKKERGEKKEEEKNDFSIEFYDSIERAYRLTFLSELGKKRIFTFDALGIVSFIVRWRRLLSSPRNSEIRTRLVRVLGQPTS